MSYGWLKGNPHFPMSWQGGGPAGGGPLYDYGAPSGSGGDGVSTDVSVQFLFDEASGNLVDEIAGVTLTAAGTITYNQTESAPYDNLSPSILLGTTGYFGKTTTTDEVKFGTGDGTIEFWFSTTATGTQYIAASYEAAYTRGWFFYARASDGVMGCNIIADDGTQVNTNYSTGITTFADGNLHKVRIVHDRAGFRYLYFDGVEVGGPTSLSTIATKNVPAESLSIGSLYASAKTAGLVGKVAEFRFSKNATNNSGP